MAPVPDGHSPPPADLPGTPQIRGAEGRNRPLASPFGSLHLDPVQARRSEEQLRRRTVRRARRRGSLPLRGRQPGVRNRRGLGSRHRSGAGSSGSFPRRPCGAACSRRFRVTADLPVINVSMPAATRFGQTAWLTTCDSYEYPHTRQWGDWLRRKAPAHAGFVWRSRRDLDRLSYVFFERQVLSAARFRAHRHRHRGARPRTHARRSHDARSQRRLQGEKSLTSGKSSVGGCCRLRRGGLAQELLRPRAARQPISVAARPPRARDRVRGPVSRHALPHASTGSPSTRPCQARRGRSSSGWTCSSC